MGSAEISAGPIYAVTAPGELPGRCPVLCVVLKVITAAERTA